MVFVPKEWQETRDMSLQPTSVMIGHSTLMLFEATIEFMERMCTYMYEDSDNPKVVPLVVALKANALLHVCVETM